VYREPISVMIHAAGLGWAGAYVPYTLVHAESGALSS
jgi:hypothetical protein